MNWKTVGSYGLLCIIAGLIGFWAGKDALFVIILVLVIELFFM